MSFDARILGTLALVTLAVGCDAVVPAPATAADAVGHDARTTATQVAVATPPLLSSRDVVLSADPSVTASRTAAAGESPAYQPKDTLSMVASFAGRGASVTMTFPASVPTDQSIPLVVVPGAGEGVQAAYGAGADSGMSLTYVPGIGAGAIEGSALRSAMLDVATVPASDGESLGVILTLQFADGRQLTRLLSASVTSDHPATSYASASAGQEVKAEREATPGN